MIYWASFLSHSFLLWRRLIQEFEKFIGKLILMCLNRKYRCCGFRLSFYKLLLAIIGSCLGCHSFFIKKKNSFKKRKFIFAIAVCGFNFLRANVKCAETCNMPMRPIKLFNFYFLQALISSTHTYICRRR